MVETTYLDTLATIILLFVVATYIRTWMIHRHAHQCHAILYQFHQMFYSAYNVLTEAEMLEMAEQMKEQERKDSGKASHEEIVAWDTADEKR